MVAVIKSGKSIRAAFLYNENKVREGIASGLMAMNYPMEFSDMTETMRLNMLLKRVELNTAVTRNSIHISLNFAPEEQHSQAFLKELTQEYMDRIGFGGQPYLVYQHFDSGHPHVHIVTTTVKPDGGRIETQNIGKNVSEPARKEMEIKYGLVKAEDHKKSVFQPKPVNAAVVQYGKTPTKRAISSILSAVLNTYKYTSLAELNALLGLYNVMAQRGDEDSRMYKNKGLAYRVINAEGHPISTPIKASAFHQKALLKDIECRFLKNDVDRQAHKSRVKVALDWNLCTPGITLETLMDKLKQQAITVVPRRNATGFVYGLTYIDHKARCIFNGSDIGKQYSAAAVLERCGQVQQKPVQEHLSTKTDLISNAGNDKENNNAQSVTATTDSTNISLPPEQKGLLEQLTQSEYTSGYLPYELKKTQKKRKKRNKHL